MSIIVIQQWENTVCSVFHYEVILKCLLYACLSNKGISENYSYTACRPTKEGLWEPHVLIFVDYSKMVSLLCKAIFRAFIPNSAFH